MEAVQKFVIGTIMAVATACIQVNRKLRNRYLPHEQLPIEDMVSDLKKNGQITPVPGYESAPGKITIIDGHRRLQALTRLGKDMFVRIIDKPKSRKEEVALRVGAGVGLHLSTMDKAVQMKELYSAGFTQKEIGARYVNSQGKCYTDAYVSMCLNLLNLVGPAQDLIHRGVKGCGVKWGIAVGKMKAVDQLAECKKMETDGTALERIHELIRDAKGKVIGGDDPGIQTPEQVGDEEAENTTTPEGNPSPRPAPKKQQGATQRTLTHVQSLLQAILDSTKLVKSVSPKHMAKLLLGFCQNRDADMVETVEALGSADDLKEMLAEIDELNKEAEAKAEADAKAKAAEVQARHDKALADRKAAGQAAWQRVFDAGWIPMKCKEGEQPGRWKDPTNDKSEYISTQEAFQIIAIRQ